MTTRDSRQRLFRSSLIWHWQATHFHVEFSSADRSFVLLPVSARVLGLTPDTEGHKTSGLHQETYVRGSPSWKRCWASCKYRVVPFDRPTIRRCILKMCRPPEWSDTFHVLGEETWIITRWHICTRPCYMIILIMFSVCKVTLWTFHSETCVIWSNESVFDVPSRIHYLGVDRLDSNTLQYLILKIRSRMK